MSLEQDQLDAPSVAAPRDGVGYLLRMTREQRGQDLESVARALRIRHPYLVAIEEGRYRDLPGAPYASGFVRSYAEFLGLDANEILRRFRDESGGLGARTELVFPAPVSEGGFPAAVLIVLVIILAAIVYGIWYFYQWHRSTSAEAVSTLPSRLAALIHAPGGQDQPEADAAGSEGAQASPAPQIASAQPSAAAASAPAQPVSTATPAMANPAAPTTASATSAPPSQPSTSAVAPAQPASAPAAATEAPPPAAGSSSAPAPAPAPTVVASTANTAAPSAPPAPPPVPLAPAAADQAPASEAVPKEVAKAEPPQPEPSSASAGTSGTPTAAVPAAPDLGPPSRVVLRATDDCWVEIRDASGAVVVARLLRKGDAYPVPPRPGLTLTVGNAGALALLLDGSALPPLGRIGMVRHDVPLDPERLSGMIPAAATAAPAPAPSPAPATAAAAPPSATTPAPAPAAASGSTPANGDSPSN